MSDAQAPRWSYYAGLMRSAVTLGNRGGDFSGYIVPRSSGQRPGGMLQRIVSMVAGGAKGITSRCFFQEKKSWKRIHRIHCQV